MFFPKINIIELIERVPVQVVTLEHWDANYGKALQEHSGIDVGAFRRCREIYTQC